MTWNDDHPPVFWEFALLYTDENGLPDGWHKHTARRLVDGVTFPEGYVKLLLANCNNGNVKVMGVRTIDAR